MLVQKIFGAGNSDVVAIPKGLMKELGLKRGQRVALDKILDGSALVIKKVEKADNKSKSELTKEFKKWLKEVLEEDKEILDELSLR